MLGKIESGQLVTVIPASTESTLPEDIVLCKVNGCEYLHLVKAIGKRGCLIGNNRGKINGWTKKVYGKVVQIEP